MCKKTQEQKFQKNQEILLSLLEEDMKENVEENVKDGISLNGIFIEFEEIKEV